MKQMTSWTVPIDWWFKNSLMVGTNSLSSSKRSRKGMSMHRKCSVSSSGGLAMTLARDPGATLENLQVFSSRGKRARTKPMTRHTASPMQDRRKHTIIFLRNRCIFWGMHLWLWQYYIVLDQLSISHHLILFSIFDNSSWTKTLESNRFWSFTEILQIWLNWRENFGKNSGKYLRFCFVSKNLSNCHVY